MRETLRLKSAPQTAEDEIKFLLDEVKRGTLDAAGAVKALDLSRLNEILHPRINAPGATCNEVSRAEGLPKWTGGISGAPGAAAGRVYFSADALLEAKALARQRGEDTRCILVLPAAFAGDVKAIKAAAGVLTAQGGYAAHASVVARQYGTVSLVAPELSITDKTAVLGGLSFSEGDPITLDVPGFGIPSVYQGIAEISEPDITGSALLDFITLAKGLIKNFQIRVNAETPEDAEKALSLGAEGIGLCRTEHMFFKPERINPFRELILSESGEARNKALEKLREMQCDDFYRIFKIMAGKHVTIRLLDAPLHEFMPRSDADLASYMDHISASKETALSGDEVLARIETLREYNPMLGRRGCRIAVSYPEIYAMQVRAIVEAVHKMHDEKLDVQPEIMVPLVMNAAELKLIAYGKRAEGASYAGIAGVEEFLNCPIGAMIELPAAALGAGDIARYAQFFSFGTNDLTQTTLGLSRDDAAGFLPAYSHYDLLEGNPFSVLDERVKELIALAVDRGRLTRPDLVCGLCGEQGADPAAIRFCIDTGINYVSCSPYAVPAAIVAAAQILAEKK
ncbi:pyruvate, phosphate dikinase [Treponema primitia]|uniref:putative PEP-binding protein n=1 Tax=Treponema primitia TaxID=88058 RepID=UPI00397E930E